MVCSWALALYRYRLGCDEWAGVTHSPPPPPGSKEPSSAVGRAGGRKQAAESFSETHWSLAEEGRLHEAVWAKKHRGAVEDLGLFLLYKHHEVYLLSQSKIRGTETTLA